MGPQCDPIGRSLATDCLRQLIAVSDERRKRRHQPLHSRRERTTALREGDLRVDERVLYFLRQVAGLGCLRFTREALREHDTRAPDEQRRRIARLYGVSELEVPDRYASRWQLVRPER